MSYARLGSLDALSLRLVRDLTGPARAEVELGIGDDAAPAEGSSAVLTIGSVSLVGTVERSTADNGRARVAWVQGAGQWDTVLSPRTYRDVLVRTIAEHLVADAGETITSATLAALPDIVIGYWHRHEVAAGECLSALCRYAGLGWRHDAAGAVTIAEEAWPTFSDPTIEVLSDDGADYSATFASESPTLAPGVTWLGRRVERVVYTIEEHGDALLRGVATFVRPSAAETTRGAFERAVRAQIRELHYLPRYGARVVAQAADGRLELEPDAGQGQAGTGAVPVLYGLPGVRCEVPAGSRVGLAYEAGRADQPRAMGWEQETAATVIRIDVATLLQLAGGSARVHRVGDHGTAGSFSSVVPGVVIYTDPDGVPQWTIALVSAAPGSPVEVEFAPLPGATVAPGVIVTKATEGAEKVHS